MIDDDDWQWSMMIWMNYDWQWSMYVCMYGWMVSSFWGKKNTHTENDETAQSIRYETIICSVYCAKSNRILSQKEDLSYNCVHLPTSANLKKKQKKLLLLLLTNHNTYYLYYLIHWFIYHHVYYFSFIYYIPCCFLSACCCCWC